MIEPHYTIEEAATLLRKKPKTVSNMISARKITVVSTRPALIPLEDTSETHGICGPCLNEWKLKRTEEGKG